MSFKKIFGIACVILVSNFSYADDDITVLLLNDFHGQMQPLKNKPGAAKISTFLKDYQQSHPNTIIVLGGDNYQGTAISNLSRGAVANEFFNHIGVSYSAVGNHDFDYGQSAFTYWESNINFKYLASNIIETNTGSIFASTTPYAEKTLKNGRRVAFIGLATLETPDTTATKNISGLEFTNPALAANPWVNFLNSKANPYGKPDTIILLTHIPSQMESGGKISYNKNQKLGTSEIDYVSKKVKGISAILSGHSHQAVSGFLNGVAVVQGASQGIDLGVLHYDCHTTSECKVSPELINLSTATKDVADDPVVNQIIAKYYKENEATLNQLISTSKVDLSNQPANGFYNINLTYTIADEMRKYAKTQIGIQNTYGVRRSLPAGAINYSMLYETLPFDNTLVTLNISGKELLKLIEHSLPQGQTQLAVFAGVRVLLAKNGKIAQVFVDGSPLNKDAVYSVATIDFLLNGGDGFNFSSATDISNTNLPVRDIIKAKWQKDGISVPIDWQNIEINRPLS
ncbi:bifunctional metallophosphatase/5'-nucleotidase [Aquella oligotrophica]|uniref:Bifunctional metallophosphatase/5'-nucleotidase n=1 Tax=Aquella oligotrophica TaxID=2067065 RepID=A0A2I7N5J6_9NEIS|nr:5'-nucleotidase C-terminal domain-containing protein [Aquella oligotrophica]AUR51720.1 bifunctional metallophosphatase/5'-nucleotidase [Aquella oligotrophica]